MYEALREVAARDRWEGGFGACDAPRAHNRRTLGKSQRTVNFPPIQNYRQAHPHVITLRFGLSANEMAGAHRPPT